MNNFINNFIITDAINCPLYQKGETMMLTDKTFNCPAGREVCLILIRDMTQLLFKLLAEQSSPQQPANSKPRLMSCSGCTGLIKFKPYEKKEYSADSADDAIYASLGLSDIQAKLKDIDSPFLRAIPQDKLAKIMHSFHEIQVQSGTIVIYQDEPNPNLYLVAQGMMAVELNGVPIAQLGKGELFGEMSYLASEVAASTVRAVTPSSLLAMSGDSFGKLMEDIAPVQAFMARLLASRLQALNVARAKDFDSCMSGRLDEVAPAELFQVFHMHQKTGVLSMNLHSGKAKVSFREGCIINAHYNGKVHEAAIFAILAEKKGFYRFTTGLSPVEMKAAEIGDFMMLLMEGVKRIDEAHPEH